MSTLTVVLLIIALVVAAALAYAATRPDVFTLERSARIDAAPERIYPLLVDFHHWPSWSPWEKLDPTMARTHGGAPSGTGAVYEWSGNSKAGAGRMEILEAAPPSRLDIQLDFTRPFKASNTTSFVLTPEGAGTLVHWSMRGENTFMGKVMSIFIDMDRMVGKDFEAGLGNLKALAEQPAPVA